MERDQLIAQLRRELARANGTIEAGIDRERGLMMELAKEKARREYAESLAFVGAVTSCQAG